MSVSAQKQPTGAGFFSSARRMSLPAGPASDPDRVRGYPIDLRVKAQSAIWPAPGLTASDTDFVSIAQYGLGCYERWLSGEGEGWLGTATRVGRYLLGTQEADGSWLNRHSMRHTFLLEAPWRCAMAQGEVASLLVRLCLHTGEAVFAEAAIRALAPLSLPSGDGGVCGLLGGDSWPEEYPTSPPSFVLNGAIFAWWGLRDVAVGLGDGEALAAFERGVDTLAANLYRFDTGWWSLYCLFPHPVKPVASSFYHALHIAQLEAMHKLAPRPEFEATRIRWTEYLDSGMCRRRAVAAKVLYRVVIPRNRLLGHRLPWVTPRG